MKLMDLFEKKSEPVKGTYAAVKFSKDTMDNIKDFVDKHNIPNPLPSDKYHTTLIYSRKYLPDFKSKGKYDEPLIGKPEKLEIFETQDKKNALVLRYECKDLTDRHNEIMDEHKATYDFPEYKIHITLSYDCGDFDPKSIKDIEDEIKPIEIVEEYDDELKLDWAKDK